LTSVTAGTMTVHLVAYLENPRFQIAAPSLDAGRPIEMFARGMRQSLSGYQPLVLLLALVLAGGRRTSLTAAAAFILATAIGSSFAICAGGEPRAAILQPALAFATAYVGIENWLVNDASGRWLIAVPFGLAQGWIWAEAWRQSSLRPEQIPLALVSFTSGGLAGGLATLAMALPIVWCLRRNPWVANRGLNTMSGAIAILGVLELIGVL
jgi:hypothetical protein